jgi:hypothetical protein
VAVEDDLAHPGGDREDMVGMEGMDNRVVVEDKEGNLEVEEGKGTVALADLEDGSFAADRC